MGRAIYLIATMDSKGHEVEYVARCIREVGLSVVMVDVGTKDAPTVEPDISRDQVIALPSRSASSRLAGTRPRTSRDDHEREPWWNFFAKSLRRIGCSAFSGWAAPAAPP